MARHAVSAEDWVLTRQKGKLNLARHAEVGFELRVLGLKLGRQESQPVSFFLQGVLQLFDGGEILVNAGDADDFAPGIPKGQFGGVIPRYPPVRMHEPLDFTDERLPGLHDAPFIFGGAPGRLFRPEIKVALADEIRRVPRPHEIRHRPADAEEPALGVFEINLVWGILEEKPEKVLAEGNIIHIRGNEF